MADRPRTRRHGEGSITSYRLRGGSKRYRYQLRVPVDPENPEGATKLIGKGGYRNEDEAGDGLREAKRKRDLGVAGTSTGVPTVAQYAQTWVDNLDREELAPSTVQAYERIVRLRIIPQLGAIRLDKLTASRIARHYRELRDGGRADHHHKGEGLSSNSVNKTHIVLGAILDDAVADGHIFANPARVKRTVKAPTGKTIRAQRPEIVTWTGPELAAFLTWDRDVMQDDMFTLWRTIAYTGMRRSEALALRWGDVSITRGTVAVRRAADVTTRGRVKSTKTHSVRVLDIDADTTAALKAWKAVRGSISLNYARPDAYVFGNLDGEMRSPNEVSRRWKLRVQKARIALGNDNLRTVTLKGLRHTHATLMLELGVHPKVVQERLGHSDITTTMNVYSHVTPTMQRAAIDRLSQHVGAS